MSPTAPKRLLVFLHGAGSTPEAFAPVAIAWQLKFPGARAIILQAPLPARVAGGADWFDATAPLEQRRDLIADCAERVAQRIRQLQADFELGADRTVVVGFSQGATVALELGRLPNSPVQIVVSYAGRLARPISRDERVGATIHLIHGQLDSWVPVTYAQQALRGLRAIGAQVSLDITEDGIHSIGTDMIIIGTTRAMQTVFKGRARPLHLSARARPMLH